MAEQVQWNSTMSFLFAMIGVAVGLGNIWRFSYIVYENGGGSFFIPYLLAILIMGIPFIILEYGVGFSFKTSFTEILKKINPKFEYIAWILILFTFVVTIYYIVILGWDLVYLISSLSFSWGNDPTNYFTLVGGTSNINDFGFILIPTAIAVLSIWFILWFISNRDINSGIGFASKIFISLLFLIMAIIISYALTLPGASLGINTLLSPKWNMLLDVNIWLAAFSQIIFSLACGEAQSLTYAIYLPENSRLVDNALFVVACNSLFEICTAFGVFSILGFMSYTIGTPISELISEGTGLIFIVFPTIFNVMGTIGRILAPLLFLAILFAGLTSAFGFLEPIISSTQDKFGWSRRKTTTVLCIVGCLFSLIFTTGISNYLVGVVDLFINKFAILLLVAIQAIIFGWVYDIGNIFKVVNEHSRIKIGRIWIIDVKYILPLILFSLWFIGILGLFRDMNNFELAIDLIILGFVLVFSYIFTKKESLTE